MGKKRDRSKERKKKKHTRDHSDDEQHSSSHKRKDKDREKTKDNDSVTDKDRKDTAKGHDDTVKSKDHKQEKSSSKKDDKSSSSSSKQKEDKLSSKDAGKSVVAYSSDSEDSDAGDRKKESSRRKRKSRHADDDHDTRSSKSRRHHSPDKDSRSSKDKKRAREDDSDDDKRTSSRKKAYRDSEDYSKQSSSSSKKRSQDVHRSVGGDGSGDDSKPDLAADDSSQGANSIVKSGTLEMSIEETNKLRAKLGLKPLQVDSETNKENDTSETAKPAKKEDIHVPPKNIADLQLQEKMKEKLEVIREKRRIHKSLQEVKSIAEQAEEESAEIWVDKLRRTQKEKEIAEQRARQLEELDEEFGISDLMKEETMSPPKQKEKAEEYTSRDLHGLKVEHSEGSFREGKDIILTLKDSAILDDVGDVLENIDIIEKQKAKKNVELKNKKVDYNPYEDDEFDQYGNYQPKVILKKYKEEIEGVKKDSIVLDEGGSYDATEERERQIVRERLRANAVSLEGVQARVASEYYSAEEMLKFKKPRKKKKLKKQALKPDDLVPLADGDPSEFDHGSRSTGRRRLDEEDIKMETDDAIINSINWDMEPSEPVVSTALQRAKRIKNVKQEHSSVAERVASLLANAPRVKEEPIDYSQQGDGMSLVLDSTAEFCRQVGGDESDRRHSVKEEDMDFSDDGGHSPKRPESPKEQDLYQEPEPVLAGGVTVALQMAGRKGFLMSEEDRKKQKEQSRTIVKGDRPKAVYREDKDRDRDWKDRERDPRDHRDNYRSITTFAEKKDYRPDVKVEYVDDFGRMLDPKEAFRHMSHKFHGKGSGRKKTEKRVKKLQEEFNLQSTSATSGLNSILQEKQKANKAAYLVLSGAQALLTSEDIAKR
ncbi:U4/U6.U5 tri-snRNP-associated protein 1-like isoform X2 [Dysidea avara]|uniref:U4/U6.U5 tri-snRNP-associated protein 1-like isoform X2 n=1 Tax=Dysidea avara TaxID=196820 RepID=UPI00332FDF3E